MAKIIAVAGKGGVGKTTLTGLIIQYLCENGKTPILAVDADANSNLNEVLGVEAPPTLGEIREEIERAGMALHSPIPAGMAKGDYLQMRLEDAITEEKDFDLMVMGRTQGQGCYCFVNGLVQTQIQRLQANYPYLVVDVSAQRIPCCVCCSWIWCWQKKMSSFSTWKPGWNTWVAALLPEWINLWLSSNREPEVYRPTKM